MKKKLRIVFMGTPDFAVPSLDILLKEGYEVVAVITAPDKPAGRGKKMRMSPVKTYAMEKGLKVLQPEKLKDEAFLQELQALKPDLQVVVAFRMLPKEVWALPGEGTFNLHASLLPQYRGAAPINWALINGESETGVTTFFIDDKIDTGALLFQEKTVIAPDETAGQLHDRLMDIGATLVLKTVSAISEGNYQTVIQNEAEATKAAPKIYRETCKINWDEATDKIHNHIRGLSPYPAAWTALKAPDGNTHNIKVYESSKELKKHESNTREIITDHRTELKIAAKDGFISLKKVQLAGKRPMYIEDFLKGFRLEGAWEVL